MNENVNVCITPKGDKPVLHFSQFDNERVFTVTVLADDGESAAVLTGLDIEFRIRKTDSHVVTIAPESVADNVITFKTTEQLCACCGQNIASVVLMKDDMVISTLDILVDIQRDILSGGLTSESDIRNLTTQIEQIVPEVLGDDYYTKTEVDELIDDIPTFDPSNYYDKNYINTMYWTSQQIDQLFYRKTYIDTHYYTKDVVYTKSETDNLLADKADADDVMSKVTRHGWGGDVSYFSFDNNCVAPMDDIECKVTYTQSGSGTPAPDNVRPILGHSSCTITVADSDNTPVNSVTVSFGDTVYLGEVDITSGKVTSLYGIMTIPTISQYMTAGANNYAYMLPTGMRNDGGGTPYYDIICESIAPNGTLGNKFTIYRVNQGVVLGVPADFSLADYNSLVAGTKLIYPLAVPGELSFTPATTDTINGHNKVSSSTGNMKSLTYFSDVNSDLVGLIRACMI